MIEAFGAKIKICMNFMGSSGLILALCLIFLFGSEATSNLPAVDFRYRTFESPEGIETLGNATFEKNVLQLTAGGLAHSIGRAVYFDPIKIWDRATGLTLSFKTAFTFSVTRPDVNHSGDGFAFGLFPHKLIPNNSGGGNLGLYDSISSTSNYGVAVEFDLFMNSFDPDNNHVGLDLNNINSACLSTLRNYGLNLGAGNEINVKIEYDGVTGRLNVYAINASLGDPGITSMVLSCQLNVSRNNTLRRFRSSNRSEAILTELEPERQRIPIRSSSNRAAEAPQPGTTTRVVPPRRRTSTGLRLHAQRKRRPTFIRAHGGSGLAEAPQNLPRPGGGATVPARGVPIQSSPQGRQDQQRNGRLRLRSAPRGLRLGALRGVLKLCHVTDHEYRRWHNRVHRTREIADGEGHVGVRRVQLRCSALRNCLRKTAF
ncbi:lectin 1-like [Cryptomeria japonica]|uniref:lectin 1-like n=1 Tax=Cryptomeria japonica TaxID=3369 RepID=UPI0027DA90B3|nr:lectin 1-like [Cryptomeria japonica]